MQFRIDMAPAILTVRDYADEAIRNMRDIYGLCLDHSLDSLAHVDYVLAKWRDGGTKVNVMTKSLYAFGSYAGEVLREHEPVTGSSHRKASTAPWTTRSFTCVCSTAGNGGPSASCSPR